MVYNAFVFSYYFFVKKQFVEQFCVNQNKPESDCKGKCMLEKSLSSLNYQIEGEQNKEPMRNFKTMEVFLGFMLPFNENKELFFEDISLVEYPLQKYHEPSIDVDTPPPNSIYFS
jgi:hypothetical protein